MEPVTLDASALSAQKIPLNRPSLEELAEVITQGLSSNFEDVSVKTVECPDLTEKPFGLAAPGLGGDKTWIVDVGGVPYLEPKPDRTRIYDLLHLLPLLDLGKGPALLLGAGAGPWPVLKVNSEMATNLFVGEDGAIACNQTRFALVGEDGGCVLRHLPDESRFCLMANLVVTQGRPKSPVLEVRASRRTGLKDLVGSMRKALQDKYKHGAPVALGGVFAVNKGTSHIHVMPDFPKEPFQGPDAVANWLHFYDFPAPMSFMSVFVSHDTGLSLRVEHSHGYSSSDGGHYHYDISPNEVEYVGYFTPADHLLRLDRPTAPWSDPCAQ